MGKANNYHSVPFTQLDSYRKQLGNFNEEAFFFRQIKI